MPRKQAYVHARSCPTCPTRPLTDHSLGTPCVTQHGKACQVLGFHVTGDACVYHMRNIRNRHRGLGQTCREDDTFLNIRDGCTSLGLVLGRDFGMQNVDADGVICPLEASDGMKDFCRSRQEHKDSVPGLCNCLDDWYQDLTHASLCPVRHLPTLHTGHGLLT